jgi:hypothetical protein
MPTSGPAEILFRQLTLLLNHHRFKRESDESGFKLFGRKRPERVDRIGILTRAAGSSGEFALSVVMGIEFTDLEPDRCWIGMPRTHGSVELRLLNKAAKKEYVCTEDSDVRVFEISGTGLLDARSPLPSVRVQQPANNRPGEAMGRSASLKSATWCPLAVGLPDGLACGAFAGICDVGDEDDLAGLGLRVDLDPLHERFHHLAIGNIFSEHRPPPGETLGPPANAA